MRRTTLIGLSTLLCGLLLTVMANDRGESAPSYVPPDRPAATGDARLSNALDYEAPEYIPSEALQQLRTEWDARFLAVKAEVAQTEERDRQLQLEQQLAEMKREQYRAELHLLLSEAEAGGDQEYAARLREVIEQGVEPAATPYPATTVKRDPATGRALAGEEGDAR